jgi:hypothetical protein
LSLGRVAALALLLAFSGPAAAESIAVSAEPVQLDPQHPGKSRVGALHFLAGFVLRSGASDWGGWSGMLISSDGKTLTAISDVGHWLRLELRHDPSGRMIGIGPAAILPVLDRQGRPLVEKRWADAEALVRDTDGSLLVAFERQHRILRYAQDAAGHFLPPTPVDAPAAIQRLPANSGIESMVVLDGGRLLLISEAGLPGEPDIAVWLGRPGAWSRLTLARAGGLAASDATRLPSGDLLLVERDAPLVGVAVARLSIIPRAAIRPGARLVGTTLADLAPPLVVDNFEAVAARPGPDGSTLIYLLSDDNQSFLQRTLLFQFRLDPAPPGGGPAVAGSP